MNPPIANHAPASDPEANTELPSKVAQPEILPGGTKGPGFARATGG